MKLWIKRLVGLILAAIGIPLFIVSLLAIIDPVGTKMADDGDPFGRPPPVSHALLLSIFTGVLSTAGILLLRAKAVTLRESISKKEDKKFTDAETRIPGKNSWDITLNSH